MNLAIRGIDANLGTEHADSFHRDLHPDLKADYILANPPFNDSDWRGELLREDKRWSSARHPPATPTTPGCSTSSTTWRPGLAGFVLANGSLRQTSPAKAKSARRSSRPTWWTASSPCPPSFLSTQIPVCLWFIARDKGRNYRDQAAAFRDRRGDTCLSTPASSARLLTVSTAN